MSDAAKAIFLSYAREDADVARRIAEALRAFGVEVWFDQNELRGGDAWDTKIRTQIKSCALFIPLVSQRTEERAEGYFRREWKLAIDRTQDMGSNRAFIVPVVIDRTREAGADVPEEFMRYQWTRLADGEPTPEFVMQVKRLLEGPKKAPGASAARTASGSAPAAASAGPAPSAASRSPLTLGVIAIVAVAAAVYFALRPAAKEPAPPAVPAKAVAEVKAPVEPAAPVINEKSIAVLPFANMSEEKDSGFFADGIHEDILTNLALVRELHVVSRTSVMQYRGTTKTIKQIASELGVAYVLEGSVRRAGNKVRVTGQLIRAASDEHVWAKAYDRDLTDIFSIQSALATEIAGALSAALSPQEKQLIERRPTDNLAAYDAYVKARQVSETNTAPALKESEDLLKAAVKLDPKFAAAWGLMGRLIAFQYFGGTDHTPERLAEAKAAIEAAVRLAPDGPEVIEYLGDYYYYGYRDYARAVEQYQRLAVLRPNDGAVFGSIAFIHRRQGRFAEALDEFRRAARLEPRSLRYVRAWAETAQGLGLYDEALPAMRRAVELTGHEPTAEAALMLIPFLARGSTTEGEDWLAHLTPAQRQDPTFHYLRKLWARSVGDFATAVALDREQRYADVFGEPRGVQDTNGALTLAALGDRSAARTRATEAVRDLEQQVAIQPTNETLWASLGQAYALLGDRTESLRCAQRAIDLVPESKDAVVGPINRLAYASCLAWLGDKDRALAELARLLRTPWGENIYSAKFGATWFPLRGDPRFEALVNDPKNNAPLVP